jgi:hypothetical protein
MASHPPARSAQQGAHEYAPQPTLPATSTPGRRTSLRSIGATRSILFRPRGFPPPRRFAPRQGREHVAARCQQGFTARPRTAVERTRRRRAVDAQCAHPETSTRQLTKPPLRRRSPSRGRSPRRDPELPTPRPDPRRKPAMRPVAASRFGRPPRALERAVASIHTGGRAWVDARCPVCPRAPRLRACTPNPPVVRSTTQRPSDRGDIGRGRADAPASPKARQLHAQLLTRCRASGHGVFWSGLLSRRAVGDRKDDRVRPGPPGGCPWHGRPGDAPIPKDLHITDFATPESTARNVSSRHHRNKPELVGVQAHRG